jgi:hypothetical protein
MRFMLLMYPDAGAAYGTPDAKSVEAMMKYNEDLAKAGVLLALDGLQSSAKGARVYFPGGKAKVVDGPFSEAKELVGGYWMIQTRSRAEAVEWAKRVPVTDASFVELRQVFELTDFPADVQAAAESPTVRAAVERTQPAGR